MYLFLTFLIAVFFAAALAWNFVPAAREKMRGYSTMVEGLGAALIGYASYAADWYGALVESLEGSPYREYLPDNLATYVPLAIVIWAVIKRIQTTSPLGKKL